MGCGNSSGSGESTASKSNGGSRKGTQHSSTSDDSKNTNNGGGSNKSSNGHQRNSKGGQHDYAHQKEDDTPNNHHKTKGGGAGGATGVDGSEKKGALEPSASQEGTVQKEQEEVEHRVAPAGGGAAEDNIGEDGAPASGEDDRPGVAAAMNSNAMNSNETSSMKSNSSKTPTKSSGKGVQFSEDGGSAGEKSPASSDSEADVAQQAKRKRSKSIAVLEGISRGRQKSFFCQEPLSLENSANENKLLGSSMSDRGQEPENPLAMADKSVNGEAFAFGTSGSPVDSTLNPPGGEGGVAGEHGPDSVSSSTLSQPRVPPGGGRRRSSFAPPNPRQRRLSSVFNEFATQVDNFLSKERQQGRTTAANSGGSPSSTFLSSTATSNNPLATPKAGDEGSGTSQPFASVTDSPLEGSGTGHSTSLDALPGDGGGSSSATTAEPSDDLRRIYDAFESEEGAGLTVDDLKNGFERMGFGETPGATGGSSSAQLHVMFKAADKKKSGRLLWPEFKAFFRHLAEMNTDDLAEEDDQVEVVRRNDRERAMSFAQCPVTFKSYTLEPVGSLPSRVKALSMSPHRKIYAASDRFDNQAHIFDLESGERVRSLVGHKDSLLCICLSPDRKYVATCSRDGFLTLWDSTIGSELGAVQHPGIVTCCTFTSDGKVIITGCQDNIVRRFKCHRTQLERTMMPLPQTELGVIVSVASQKHAKDKVLFSRSNDKGAFILDYGTFRVIGELSGHTALVWQVDFCQNGIHAISVCEKELRIWEVVTQTCLHVICSSNPSLVGSRPPLPVSTDRPKLWTTAQFAPPQFGSVVIACCTDTNIFLYDVSSGKMIWNETSKSTCYVASSGVDVPCIMLGDDLGNILRLSLNGNDVRPSHYQENGTYPGGSVGPHLRQRKLQEAEADKLKEKKSTRRKR